MIFRRSTSGAAVEVRAATEGPTLHGVMVTEGRAASGGRREVFAPGAVEWPSEGVGILLAHRQAPEVRAVAAREPDGRITVRAPATPAIREAVEAGRRFMSVEFHALEERTTAGGVREVLRALVPSAALVADPEYDTTVAEVRRRIGGVRSGFTEGEALDCRCGPIDCDTATIETGALVIPDGTPAFLSTFGKPLGPATVARDGAKVTVSAEVRDTSWGRDLMEAGTDHLIVRPYPHAPESEWTKEGRDRRFTRLTVAAWVYSWTDQTGGFEESTLATRGRDRREKPGNRGVGGRGSGSSALGADSGRFGKGRRTWL